MAGTADEHRSQGSAQAHVLPVVGSTPDCCRREPTPSNIRPSTAGLNSIRVAPASAWLVSWLGAWLGPWLGAWLVPWLGAWPVPRLGAWLGARLVPIRCVPHARAPRSVDLSKRIRRRLSLAHPAAYCRGHCEQAFTVQATVEGGLHSSDGTIRGYTGIMKFTDDPQTHYGATWILVCRREETERVKEIVQQLKKDGKDVWL